MPAWLKKLLALLFPKPGLCRICLCEVENDTICDECYAENVTAP